MLKKYLKRIFETARHGDAREESYYSCIQELFKEYANSVNKNQVHITPLPKKTDAGNPDFRIWDGKQNIVGYIEAKIQPKKTWITSNGASSSSVTAIPFPT